MHSAQENGAIYLWNRFVLGKLRVSRNQDDGLFTALPGSFKWATIKGELMRLENKSIVVFFIQWLIHETNWKKMYEKPINMKNISGRAE